MSSPQFHPQEAPGPRRTDAARPPAPGYPTVDKDLLNSILQRTMALFEGDGEWTAEECSEFEAVVRRYQGEPLQLDPVARELVEAVLRVEFRERPGWTALWPDVSAQIAQALWEDPVSRGRLETLWGRLARG